MAETIEQTRVRLIDDGWFERLYKKGNDRCAVCGYDTNRNGDCLCHEAARHMMGINDFLQAIGKPPDMTLRKVRPLGNLWEAGDD